MVLKDCRSKIKYFVDSVKKRNFNESVDLSVRMSKGNYAGFRTNVYLPQKNGLEDSYKIISVMFADECDKKDDLQNKVNLMLWEDSDFESLFSNKNKLKEYDWCLATPRSMKLLSPYARVLSSQGLMPNVKLGTLGDNISHIVDDIRLKGMSIYKADKFGIVNIKIGNILFSADDLFLNIKSVLNSIDSLSRSMSSSNDKANKNKSKGNDYNLSIESLYLSTTMSKGSLKLNLVDFDF